MPQKTLTHKRFAVCRWFMPVLFTDRPTLTDTALALLLVATMKTCGYMGAPAVGAVVGAAA